MPYSARQTKFYCNELQFSFDEPHKCNRAVTCGPWVTVIITNLQLLSNIYSQL